MNRVLIVVPTYNEARNIETLITRLASKVPEADILVIDDNSPDGTGRIVDEMSGELDRVKAHHRPRKMGIGSAHLHGLSHAIAAGYEVGVTIDADFTHDPASVPELIDALRRRPADVVVGSRYHADGIRDWGLLRKVITRTAHCCTRLLLGMPYDATGGLRAYRMAALVKVDLSQIQSDGYSFLFEMLYRCHRQSLRIAEIPVSLSLRQAGASKISRVEIVRALATLLRLTWFRVFGSFR